VAQTIPGFAMTKIKPFEPNGAFAANIRSAVNIEGFSHTATPRPKGGRPKGSAKKPRQRKNAPEAEASQLPS
jgi:hypothetical protein